jgi:hypothetical protein
LKPSEKREVFSLTELLLLETKNNTIAPTKINKINKMKIFPINETPPDSSWLIG